MSLDISAEQREQIRLSLLRYGLGSFTIALAHQYLGSEGFRGITKREVQAEVNYLADAEKGLLRQNDKLISPEVATYSTTSKGRDFLAQEGVT